MMNESRYHKSPLNSPWKDKREHSEIIAGTIEKEVLPRLQSGAETHVVISGKKPQIAAFPALPSATTFISASQKPLIRKGNPLHDQWLKDSSIGFVYVIRGEADLLLGGRVVTCYAGNFAFFLPNTRRNQGTASHWERDNLVNADCDLLWLFVKSEEVFSHLCWSRGTQHFSPPNLFIPDNRLLPLVELLHDEIAGSKISSAATQILWLIFDRVRRKIQEERFLMTHSSSLENSNEDNSSQNIGERARQYVDANLMERLTLDSVARAIFTSRAKLSPEFQAYTGETFANYISRCRIVRAQDMLIKTSSSIRDIAWHSGFSDPDYFSAVFHRSVGMTPSQFRKRRR